MAGEEDVASKASPIRAFNARKLIVSFFAFVGFAASVVTVLEYIRPADVSALDVTVSVHPFRTPHYASKELQSGEPARELSSTLQQAACGGIDTDELNRQVRSEIEQIDDKDERENKLSCYDAISVEFAARWIGEFSEGDSTLLEYQISNIGRKSAEDIRIQGKTLNSLQYQSGSSFINVKKNSGDDYYELPKLNPGEQIRVLAWSQTYLPSLKYAEWDDYPIVTFAGSEVHTELEKPVPDGWYNLYDFFHDAPIVIILIFAIGFSLVVVLILYCLVGLIMVMATGKSFSEVFSNAQKPEAKAGDPE